jgi:hypothetical protein
MQALDQSQRLKIVWPNMIEPDLTLVGLDRLDDGFHE